MEIRPDQIDEHFGKQAVQERSEILLKELSRLKKRLGEESIHDTRVQSRHVRAALEAFKDIFPQHPWNALYDQIRQITRTLGKARETQTALTILKQLTVSGDMAENLCREYIEERFKKKLTAQHRRMKKKLAGLDPRRLGEQLDFLLSGASSSAESVPTSRATGGTKDSKRNSRRLRPRQAGQASLFDMTPEPDSRARRVFEELAEPILSFRTRYAFKRATDERLHRLRIAAKKLRYPLEIFDPVWPGSLQNEITLARALQDVGGTYHDWCVLRSALQSELRRLTRPETSHMAFQVSRLLAQANDRRAETRKEILPAIIDLQNALFKLQGESIQAVASPRRSPMRVSKVTSKVKS